MQLIRGVGQIQPFKQGCILTIGNFDGVHRGHQAVIASLLKLKAQHHLPIVVMVFEPQPMEYFLRDNAPPRLTRLQEKVLHLNQLPIDYLLILRFDQAFADTPPEHFIEHVLLEKLNIKHLIVGDDFHFGKARRGNFALLQEFAATHDYTVADTPSFLTDNHRVSSTLIRDALIAGDLTTAAAFLGRAYSVYGQVVHGEKRGRSIGFPTANIQLQRENTPINGVFAVTMTGIVDEELKGVANVGVRPTFEGGTTVLLEVHLFDFDQDIYGKVVEVHFLEKIRDEIKFQSLHELKGQIHADVINAKRILQS